METGYHVDAPYYPPHVLPVQRGLYPRHNACFAIRLTTDEMPNIFWENLNTLCEGIASVMHEEPGKRKHYHVALWNATVNHDNLRKKIKIYWQEALGFAAEGNEHISVKKWDGADTYLVYMIKGKNPLLANYSNSEERDGFAITPEHYEELKNQWRSRNSQENDYSAFKNSQYFPQPVVYTARQQFEATGPLEPYPFDTVKKAAIAYAVNLHGGFVNAKVRYIAKDLISNFCLFNNVAMRPFFI